MLFFRNDCHDPAFNLALEEHLCSSSPEPLVMLWRNAPAVIVGRNQNTHAEVNTALAEEKNISVVRRLSGGGAVYHDLGNINYSFLIHSRHPGSDSFREFASPVVKVLQKMGVDALFSGRNDILVGERKISGSAQCCIRERTLFHGTLLFSTDMEQMSGVLTPSRAKIDSKGVKSVRARVANLNEFLPGITVEEFMTAMEDALCADLKVGKMKSVPDEFINAAEKLADERYRKWEWNYGNNFPCDWSNGGRFAGGNVELKFRVANGLISEARISGDFFGRRDIGELENKVKDLPFRKEDIARAWQDAEIGEYISNVTLQDLLSLI